MPSVTNLGLVLKLGTASSLSKLLEISWQKYSNVYPQNKNLPPSNILEVNYISDNGALRKLGSASTKHRLNAFLI